MWLFPLRQGKVMKVIDNWAYISSLAIILLAYYLVYCPSFPRQRGLDSETCLDGLIAFLHSLRSWAKEVDDRSLSGSLLMLSNHFLLGRPQMKLPFLWNLRPFWAIFLHPDVGDDQTKPTETVVSDNIFDTWNTHTSF